LYILPAAILMQLIQVAILTSANIEDVKRFGHNENPSFNYGLILGSEADEEAMIEFLAIISFVYNWGLLLYMTCTFGFFWFFIRKEFLKLSKHEVERDETSKV
jgi:hypothetical protein